MRSIINVIVSFRYVCEEHWPMPMYNNYYTIALLVLQFIIPLLVLIFTYTRIAFAVWGKKPPGEAENSRDQRMAKSKRKVCIDQNEFTNSIVLFENISLSTGNEKTNSFFLISNYNRNHKCAFPWQTYKTCVNCKIQTHKMFSQKQKKKKQISIKSAFFMAKLFHFMFNNETNKNRYKMLIIV